MNVDEVLSLLAAGNRRCQVAATHMNERSNRAHRIFIIAVAFNRTSHMERTLREADHILEGSGKPMPSTQLEELGCLTIVDLAGSEVRRRRAGAVVLHARAVAVASLADVGLRAPAVRGTVRRDGRAAARGRQHQQVAADPRTCDQLPRKQRVANSVPVRGKA
jgi:hypothetical protein